MVATTNTKTCKNCGENKSFYDFYKGCRGRVYDFCKSCAALNNTRNGLRKLKYHCDPNHREQIRGHATGYYRRNKTRVLERRIEKLYGLTRDSYNKMLLSQMGACSICKNEDKLSVDHDHATGAVRGLLCQKCNVMLGSAMDSVDIMLAGIEYLKRHGTAQT